jgi:hypothetical protein
MARLKPGVTRDQAEAAMNVLYHQLNELELQQMPAASDAFKQRFLAKRLFVIAGSHGLSLLHVDANGSRQPYGRDCRCRRIAINADTCVR